MAVAFRGATAILSTAGASGAQSVSFSVGSQPVTGDLVIGGGAYAVNDIGPAIASLATTDNQGNGTYISDEMLATDGTDFTRTFIHSKTNASNAGTLQLTFTQGGSATEFISCGGVAFSGVVTNLAIDVHTSLQTLNTNTTTVSTGTTGTSDLADSVAVIAVASSSGASLTTVTATGFTNVVSQPNGTGNCVGALAYKILVATGTQTATWTYGATSGATTDDHAAAIAIYRGIRPGVVDPTHRMFAMGLGA